MSKSASTTLRGRGVGIHNDRRSKEHVNEAWQSDCYTPYHGRINIPPHSQQKKELCYVLSVLLPRLSCAHLWQLDCVVHRGQLTGDRPDSSAAHRFVTVFVSYVGSF